MSTPPNPPAKKPNPLRGVVIALLILVAIPKTREAVLTPIGALIAVGVGALIVLLLSGVKGAKR
ncbi:hypothetical protein AB0F93_00510 [Micromonospora tulbaghiae]|uniref:hypothetical protein n=1 Tax=Micromonospora tulbaghiae TaxID=479978 RepID=UPI00331BE24A